MKKLMLLMGVLVALAVTGCSTPEERIQRSVDEYKKTLPVNVEGFGRISDVYFDKNEKNVVLVYYIYDDENVLPLIKSDRELFSRIMALNLMLDRDNDMEKDFMINGLIEIKGTLTLMFKDILTNELVDVTLSAQQLKEIIKNDLSEDEICTQLIESEISRSNLSCPEIVDEGLIMTSVQHIGNYVVYNYVADENIYDIELIKNNADEVKAEMIQTLKDPGVRDFLININKIYNGIKYVYQGDQSGRTAEIVITPIEVKRQILQ